MRTSLSDNNRDRAITKKLRGGGIVEFHSIARMTAAACVLCLLLAACGMSTEEQWQEQYDLGQQYLLDGDYEQAIVAFTAAIEIDPNIVDAYLGRAEAYIGGNIESASTENLNLALTDYDTAIELDETMTEAYVNRGDVHVACGTTEDLEEAISDYTSAITLDNTNAGVYVSRGDTYAAMDTGSEDDLMAAIADYDAAIALDDSLTELYLTEAVLYVEIGDYVGAVEAYTKAMEGDLRDDEAYLGRGNAYYELAKAQIGDDSLENNGEEGTLTEETLVYLQAALDDFSAVLDSGNTSEDIYLIVAEIYILIEDYEKAAEILEEGLVSNPDSTNLKTLEKELNTLISEKEKEEIAASQRQEIEDEYWELLMTLVAMLEEDIENVGTTDWFGDEFRTFLSELVQEQFWEMENGWYLGVYPSGYVYYGEMMNGERSGYGLWFTCYSLEGRDVEAASYETNYVYEGEWSEDYPNGWGTMLQSFKYADSYTNLDYQYEIYQIEFVNGRAEGTGTMTWHQVFASGSYRREECEIQATDGELEKIHTSSYNGETYVAIFSVVMYPSLSVTVPGACIAGN